jgi:hypothetical protein
MPEAERPPYRVVYPQTVQRALRQLCERADEKGRGEEVIAAVRAMDQQLRADPHRFGDPRYELRAARLTVMSRLAPPLNVVYAVHNDRPVVFVKAISAYPPDAF